MNNQYNRAVVDINFENWYYNVPDKIKISLQDFIYGDPTSLLSDALFVVLDILSMETYTDTHTAITSADGSFVNTMDAAIQNIEHDLEGSNDEIIDDLRGNLFNMCEAMGTVVFDIYYQLKAAFNQLNITNNSYIECIGFTRLDSDGDPNRLGFCNRLLFEYCVGETHE